VFAEILDEYVYPESKKCIIFLFHHANVRVEQMWQAGRDRNNVAKAGSKNQIINPRRDK
jgi:hypothetical protein